MTDRDEDEGRRRLRAAAEEREIPRNPAAPPARAAAVRRGGAEAEPRSERRDYGPVGEVYDGFEGMFRAQAEGKIWLNDINLLRGMIFELMILELRRMAHEIAGKWDKIPVAWPSVLDEAPLSNIYARDMERLRAFCEIFSGRDHRFAISNWNAPGGGLERSLRDESIIDIDDPEDSFPWSYPIDPKAPEHAPALMKLLFLLHDERCEGALRPIVETIMEPDESLLAADCTDNTIPGEFEDVLCQTVEILAGLPAGMIPRADPPPLDFGDLLIRVRMERPPEEGETGIPLI